jgi:hypothetical protein
MFFQEMVSLEEVPSAIKDNIFNSTSILLVKESCEPIRVGGFSGSKTGKDF